MKNIIFKKFFTDSLPILPFLCRLYGNYSPFSKGSTSLLRRRDFFIAQNPPFRVLAESIVRDRHLWTASFKKGGININLKTLFLKKVFASTLLATMVMFYISAFFVVPIDVEAQVDVSKTTGSTATEKKTPCVSSKDEYCLLEPLVVGGVSKPSVNIATYLKEMFKIGIGLAGVFAVFMIIWGGFQYMSTDAVSGKSEGKEKIEGALWGLGLALGSFLILNTINPQLLEFSAGLEPIDVKRLAVRESDLKFSNSMNAILDKLNASKQREAEMRASGQTDEANKYHLEIQVEVALDALSATLNLPENGNDPKAKQEIINGVRNSINGYYEKEITRLKVALKLVPKDEITPETDQTTEQYANNEPYKDPAAYQPGQLHADEITKKIDSLKIQKEVSLIRFDQTTFDQEAGLILDELQSRKINKDRQNLKFSATDYTIILGGAMAGTALTPVGTVVGTAVAAGSVLTTKLISAGIDTYIASGIPDLVKQLDTLSSEIVRTGFKEYNKIKDTYPTEAKIILDSTNEKMKKINERRISIVGQK